LFLIVADPAGFGFEIVAVVNRDSEFSIGAEESFGR
jgi:hypothetical protein